MDKFVLLAILACSAISVVLAMDQEITLLEDLNKDARIIQGSLAGPNQFPHQALLELVNAAGGWARCTGSLISTRWVLTAAHCLRNKVRLNVRLGSVDSNKPLILIMNVTNFSFHESTATDYNDVGVINLGRDVPLSASVKPIRLPRKSQANDLFVDKVATVMGWGYLQNVGPVTNMLQYVQLKVITKQLCMQHYGASVNKTTIVCANGIKNLAQGACSGDSGGPLFIREADGLDTQIGVTSFVSSTGCDANGPSGFARLTSFLDWISKKTGIPVRP